MVPDDQELDVALAEARTGASCGYHAIFQILGGPVGGYLRARRVADPDCLANEVFLRAFRMLHTFAGDATDFRSWVFTIARNAVIDEMRSAARRPREVLDARPCDGVGGNVEDDVLARLADERVAALLQLLSRDQRDVIALRVVADLSVEQTAEVLGKTYEGVKALQRRAIARLRKALSPPEGVPR